MFRPKNCPLPFKQMSQPLLKVIICHTQTSRNSWCRGSENSESYAGHSDRQAPISTGLEENKPAQKWLDKQFMLKFLSYWHLFRLQMTLKKNSSWIPIVIWLVILYCGSIDPEIWGQKLSKLFRAFRDIWTGRTSTESVLRCLWPAGPRGPAVFIIFFLILNSIWAKTLVKRLLRFLALPR